MARDREKKGEMLSFIKYACMSHPAPALVSTLSNIGVAGYIPVSSGTS